MRAWILALAVPALMSLAQTVGAQEQSPLVVEGCTPSSISASRLERSLRNTSSGPSSMRIRLRFVDCQDARVDLSLERNSDSSVLCTRPLFLGDVAPVHRARSLGLVLNSVMELGESVCDLRDDQFQRTMMDEEGEPEAEPASQPVSQEPAVDLLPNGLEYQTPPLPASPEPAVLLGGSFDLGGNDSSQNAMLGAHLFLASPIFAERFRIQGEFNFAATHASTNLGTVNLQTVGGDLLLRLGLLQVEDATRAHFALDLLAGVGLQAAIFEGKSNGAADASSATLALFSIPVALRADFFLHRHFGLYLEGGVRFLPDGIHAKADAANALSLTGFLLRASLGPFVAF